MLLCNFALSISEFYQYYIMKRFNRKTKAMLLLWLLAICSVVTLHAQKSDGFFRNDELYNDRNISFGADIINQGFGESGGTIVTNQTFGEVPLYGGLLILSVAGIGYVIIKRIKNMKRTITLLIAISLVLSLTQCKKNVETIAQVPTSNTVTLSLNVGNGDGDGSKHSVNTTTGAVSYTSGDVLYVASEGVYLGTMSYSGGGTFSGTVNTPTVGKPMYFFFFGGKTPNEDLTAGTSTSCTVTISDQMTNLPVISCAASNENYVDGNTTYTAKLLNKCALVKFSSNVTSNVINIRDMNTVASVSFAGNIDAGTTGAVSISTDGDGVGWAILLPQDAVDGATVTASGYKSGTCNVPQITTNMFYTTGVNISLEPAAFIAGMYSVSENTSVNFSKSNLVYYDEKYRFPDGQSNYNTTYGRFLWSTASNISTQTIYDSDGTTSYGTGWRALTRNEYNYLLDTRTVNGGQGSGYSYTLGQSVNKVDGLVLYPDGYTGDLYTGSNWDEFEEAGCVFLPVGGWSDYPYQGWYWSSSYHSAKGNAYAFSFSSSSYGVGALNEIKNISIRLVRDVE